MKMVTVWVETCRRFSVFYINIWRVGFDCVHLLNFNIVEPDKSQMAIWRMHIACWIPKSTNTQKVYYLLHFSWSNGCTNAPRCYFTRTLRALFHLSPRPSISFHFWSTSPLKTSIDVSVSEIIYYSALSENIRTRALGINGELGWSNPVGQLQGDAASFEWGSCGKLRKTVDLPCERV
jgi:hypothetical protein